MECEAAGQMAWRRSFCYKCILQGAIDFAELRMRSCGAEQYLRRGMYRNVFDPDDWMGPREYVAIKPSPVRSPLLIGKVHYIV